ncbi:MAG: UDP-glucose/GDP-mannose dehydrogenase family protein [Planctomycetes bacterium]|nr:UDP-glucose/GDP-mannose dehydrogenase family protein [Planctomycetota bacterium]
MKLTIIGSGHVGLVTGLCFARKGYQVLCVDNDKEKISILKKGIVPFYEPGLDKMLKDSMRKKCISFSTSVKEGVKHAEVLFIAVGTPLGDDGSADLSYIENVCRGIARSLKDYRVIVEKSTVPVRTGERMKRLIKKYSGGADFDIVSNPEFLQEGKALKTTLYPDRIIIGVESKKAERVMRRLYARFKAPIIVTDLASAELIKHASNSFLALKISYINAVARVCELSGADVTQVAYGIGLDKRIGREFLKAGLGYGGYCLPKDVAAFAHISERLGNKFDLLHEVQKINLEQRKMFVAKAEKALGLLKGKKIALWGLSFKPDTDDTRESPAVAIAARLIKLGAKVQAYDPKVKPSKIPSLRNRIKLCSSPYEAVKETHCLLIATDWAEFKEADFKRIKKEMLRPIIIDGRNMLEPKNMKNLGFVYHGMGKS